MLGSLDIHGFYRNRKRSGSNDFEIGNVEFVCITTDALAGCALFGRVRVENDFIVNIRNAQNNGDHTVRIDRNNMVIVNGKPMGVAE
ncbi:hypothetical protein LCGC14_0380790 [marine sediment metagenome]|uniref:Uncharacterized protein n=1 Tax=marine sediment metagenome TaxID=412755 RepID=A0A0F9WBC6_9ZZZZ